MFSTFAINLSTGRFSDHPLGFHTGKQLTLLPLTKQRDMRVTTNALWCTNRDGNQCQAFPVRGSRRCKHHGGLSTGPTTYEGAQRCYELGLKAWRAGGGRARRGPNRPPAERARFKAAKLRRRKLWSERKDRKRDRQAHRDRRKRVAAGLPLFTAEELDKC